MENKKSFLLYTDLIHTVEHLPVNQRGELFTIILQYVNDKNPIVEEPLLKIAFEPIKQQLKRDLVKYQKSAERSRENGKLGGRPKEPKKPSGLNNNPDKPRKPDSVNVNVSDSVNDIVNEKKNLKRVERFTPPTQEEVYFYLTEKNKCSDMQCATIAEDFMDHFKSCGWVVGKNKPMKDWQAAANRFIPKGQHKPQRDISKL